MPKKNWGVNPRAEAARERESQKKEADKQAKKKAADDAMWEDEKNNKYLQRKAEEEKRRQAEAEKRAQLRALEQKESAELEKKKPPQKITAASIMKIRSLEEIQAQKRKEEDEKQKSKLVAQPELVPNINIRKVDLEAAEAAGIKLGADVDARSLGDAVDQLKLIDGSADDEKDRHPERRMRAAHMAFEDREMPKLKAEFPSLKFSQLKERLWEMWQKSPENPKVQAARAAAAEAAAAQGV